MNPDNLPTVYYFGDSISVHYGPYLKKFLTGTCRCEGKGGETQALLNLDIPAGANGGDSSQVLEYLQAVLVRGGLHPDLLLLNCGLHDIKTDPVSQAKQVPLPQYQQNLRAIIALVREQGISLVWIRTTHVVEAIHNHPGMQFHRFAADCEAYNQAADEIMVEANIPCIDLNRFTRSLGTDEEIICDHVHFHEPVREKQAAFLAGWVTAWASFCSLRGATR